MSERPPGFIQQLMQRRVMRVLSLYLISSFVLLQIGDITFEPLGLPGWAMRILIGALIVGLPIALILAWVFDITPEGVVRTDVRTAARQTLGTARKVEIALIIVLTAALGYFMSREWLPEAAEQLSVRSVAVLPFTEIGPKNNYLARGLTAELTNTLAAIPDLHVASYSISRLGSGLTDLEIGQTLNVANLVKGSVQQMAQTLRVGAQVVRAQDSRVLWSYQVDKQIADVFAIQDEIANNVASNLRSTLYREALSRNAQTRTDNIAAYEAYLTALHHRPNGWPKVLEYAERSTRLDPEFVPALTLVANVYLRRVGGLVPFQEAYPLARHAAQKALALAPDYAPALIAQAHLERMARNYATAESLFRRAKTIAPNHPTRDLANFLLLMGRLDEALTEYHRSMEIDPLDPGFYVSALFNSGAHDQAIEYLTPIALTGPPRGRAINSATIAGWYVMLGNTAEADRWLDIALTEVAGANSAVAQGRMTYALAKQGRTEAAMDQVSRMEKAQQGRYVSPIGLFWGYYGLNDLDRAFLFLNRAVDENVLMLLLELKTSPAFDDIRNDLRFVNVLHRLKLNEDSQH